MHVIEKLTSREMCTFAKNIIAFRLPSVKSDQIVSQIELLLDAARKENQARNYSVSSLFGEHSKYNENIVVYPSSTVYPTEEHRCLEITPEKISLRDLVIKKSQSFKQLGEMLSGLARLAENGRTIYLERVYIDLHRGREIVPGEEFHRCLAYFGSAKFCQKKMELSVSNPERKSSITTQSLLSSWLPKFSLESKLLNKLESSLHSKITAENLEDTMSQSNEIS